MTYRFSFFAGVIGQWLGYGATYFSLYIMVKKFNTLAGWTAEEVLFMYAFNLLSYAIAATVFFKPCTQLPSKIHKGEFDISLTKPMSPLAYEIYTGYSFGYIGHIILSCVIMSVFSCSAGFHFSIKNIVVFIFMLVGAILLQAAFLIIASVASFFFINNNPVIEFIVGELKRFINYPITIYWTGLQIILTVIVPVAFMSYYPVKAILGKDDLSAFPTFVSYLTPLVGGGLFFISIYVWKWGLTRYKSTGS